jgi:hypothetical protein
MSNPPPETSPPALPPSANQVMRRGGAWPWLVVGAACILTVILMKVEGRIWWCECGQFRFWISDVWTSHCSQHLADPYSLTHLSHGLLFWVALAFLFPRVPLAWRFAIAVTIAAGWEVLENSPLIINRYRTATMSLDYLGDSVVNALGDVLSCAVGFLVAQRVGAKWALAIFLALELVLILLIRDSLLLSTLMLISPIEAIKAWQTQGR